jgi:hypothetical protein
MEDEGSARDQFWADFVVALVVGADELVWGRGILEALVEVAEDKGGWEYWYSLAVQDNETLVGFGTTEEMQEGPGLRVAVSCCSCYCKERVVEAGVC